MNKIFDMILFCIMFLSIATLSQSNTVVKTNNKEITVFTNNEIIADSITPVSDIAVKKPAIKTDLIVKKYPKDTIEWYAFSGSKFKYDYKSIPYTEQELNLFTNVLYRESGMGFSVNQEVNKYLVAIVGVMRIICENHKYKTITDMIKYSNSFTYPAEGTRMRFDSTLHPVQYKTWMHCKEVAKNVLEANIPAHVPYIPHGTFCYWSDEIDTNMAQKRYLENRGICVATSIWNSHYYLIKHFAKEEELQYLIDNKLTCNPRPKIIGNGVLCK